MTTAFTIFNCAILAMYVVLFIGARRYANIAQRATQISAAKRVIQDLRVDAVDENRQFGSVIVFRKNMTRSRANSILQDLRRLGTIEEAGVYEFDPAMGGPVWYIP